MKPNITAIASTRTIIIQLGTPLELVERIVIMRTLEATRQNQRHAAAILGISVRTLQRKIKDLYVNLKGPQLSTEPEAGVI